MPFRSFVMNFSLIWLSNVAKGVGKADNAPDFVVSPGGTAFPVPKGATGPTSVVNPTGKKTGDAFTGGSGGANGQVDTMRMMDPTPSRGNSPGYPNGYIKYENKAGQEVEPYTGRTLSNKNALFKIGLINSLKNIQLPDCRQREVADLWS